MRILPARLCLSVQLVLALGHLALALPTSNSIGIEHNKQAPLHLGSHLQAQRHPYGFWDSPITPEWVLNQGNSSPIEYLFVDDITGEVFISEIDTKEGGKGVLRNYPAREPVFDGPWSARTQVHEYGGGHAVAYDGTVYFSNVPDNRVYKVKPGNEPVPVTPEQPEKRYADFTVHPVQARIIATVLEDHTFDSPAYPPHLRCVENRIAFIDTETGTVKDAGFGPRGTPKVGCVSKSVPDFWDSPRFSPDGKYLVARAWHHPYMSWEASKLWLAEVKTVSDPEGGISLLLDSIRAVAGDRDKIAIGEPNWVNSSHLVFMSDTGGYFNPWIFNLETDTARPIASSVIPEDFGEPAWWFGQSSITVLDENYIVGSSFRNGRSQLYLFNLSDGTYDELPTPYAYVRYLHRVSNSRVAFRGTTDLDPTAVIYLDIDLDDLDSVRFSTEREDAVKENISRTFISLPTSYTLKHPETGEPIHATYYPPTNPQYVGGLPGELPPVVVNVHGGPTHQQTQGLSWETQLFTSRGFPWLNVNYGGSTAYGRAYRERLLGRWGIVDVQDSVIAVKQLGERGLLDASRAVIRGGSAGGFTTFAALATEPDFFIAGNAMYGVSDLRTLQAAMHKFESHYLLKYVGGTPETDPELWWERSPISKADKIRSPLLILQGAEDPVVPVEQAVTMEQTIIEHGGRVELRIFEGEGHGWRQAETLRESWEREIAWYQNVLNASNVETAGISANSYQVAVHRYGI